MHLQAACLEPGAETAVRGWGQRRAGSGRGSRGLRGRVAVALAQNLMAELLFAQKELASGPASQSLGPNYTDGLASPRGPALVSQLL